MLFHSAGCSSNLLLDQLTLFYAEALKTTFFAVSTKMCYGCQEGHLSQTRHSCIMLTSHQKLLRYFHQILNDLDESEVIERWKATIDVTDCADCLSLVKSVSNSSWRETRIKTNQWLKKLFQSVYRMIHLERRFYCQL